MYFSETIRAVEPQEMYKNALQFTEEDILVAKELSPRTSEKLRMNAEEW